MKPLLPGLRLRNHGPGIIPVLGSKRQVHLPHFIGCEVDFRFARPVSANFGRFSTGETIGFEILLNLLAAGAAGLKVFGRIALNFKCPVLRCLEFITEPSEPSGKLRPIDGSCILLALVELVRLQGVSLAVGCLGNIENHNVRMKLRGGIAWALSCSNFAAIILPVVSAG